MRKRVMMVIPTLGGGGAERIVTDLARTIHGKRWKVLVVSLYGKEYGNQCYISMLEDAGVPVIYLDKKQGMDLLLILKIRRVIRQYQPSCIHTHLYASSYTLLASVFLRKNTVHTVHNIVSKELPLNHRILMGLAYRLHKVTAVAISQEVYNGIEEYYHLDKKYIRFIYNGIATCQFKIAAKEKREYDFLSAGRLVFQKNPLLQVRALAEVRKDFPDVKLCICGEGELKDKIKAEIKKLHLEENVILAGHIMHMEEYYKKSFFFISSSIYEGFGLSLVEAMAAGLPVIATKTNVIGEIMCDGVEGYLVENNDVIAMAEAMKNCLEKKGEQAYKQMSQNAIERSLDFSIERMAAAYERLYKERGHG